jgi:hypothetical protein
MLRTQPRQERALNSPLRCPRTDAQPAWHLTVKLRGRPEAPATGAEGAQFLSARGAKQEAHHGPLQRLLEGTPEGVNGGSPLRVSAPL